MGQYSSPGKRGGDIPIQSRAWQGHHTDSIARLGLRLLRPGAGADEAAPSPHGPKLVAR